ncbi:MAG: hypothetical protein ABA06_00190 [Parcubacteria bacterium C7867-001]|nr:MAG: hypothetical protein ABA06_00190 [Parcubacteria bacterium C7867-001]
MFYLVAVLVPLLLLSGFLTLTAYETRHNIRFFGVARAKLDARTERVAFILAHVDFGKFFFHLLRDGLAHLAHEIAQLSLVLVRLLERTLTRAVRHLRGRRAANAPMTTQAVSSSAFVETMTYFKHTLRRSRQAPPAVPAESTTPENPVG